MNTKYACCLVAVAYLFLTGCSGTGSPVEPVSPAEINLTTESNSHGMLGYYTFICHPEQGTIDIVQHRNAGKHFNVLPLLEPPPFLYLTIEGAPVINGNILDIDIGLRHPLYGLHRYTGFDVCGIVITHGSHTGYSDPQLVTAGVGDTRLMNPDGYTRWWNPVEFPHGGTILDYKDGLLGTPAVIADFNCYINAYKYFADGLSKDAAVSSVDISQRGMFSAGQKNVRHYKLNMEGGWVFNYAVDASWKKPLGDPPYIVPDDFPPEANRPEPYGAAITQIKNSLYYEPAGFKGGGDLQLLVDVYDHFNGGMNTVYTESLSGLPYVSGLYPVEGGPGYSTYQLDLSGDSLNTAGNAELMIKVRSDALAYGGVLPGKYVCNYFKHDFTIREPKGWARAWGGPGSSPYSYEADKAFDVATDSSNNIYVTGVFSWIVDFDPGPGICYETGENYQAAFLSKFTNNGVFQWVRVWGADDGEGNIEPTAIAIDDSGSIYMTGFFEYNPVDFDPGPGVDIHEPPGSKAAFISKIDSDGNFIWARSWGSATTEASDITVDDYGNVFVTGCFDSWADFDPGPGVDEHFSHGSQDVFVTGYSSDGAYMATKTWGGWYADIGTAVAVDAGNNLYVSGVYEDTVDFNPGPGYDLQTSNGGEDNFLVKFTPSWLFEWALTWGSTYVNDMESPISALISQSGDVYVAGYFYGKCDFDPGPGELFKGVMFTGPREYLSKFNPDGDFQWVRTFGQYCHAANLGSLDNIYIAGFFRGTCDFGPGSISDEHTAIGYYDACLSKFDLDGNYQWTRTWGGDNSNYTSGVTTDQWGNVFISGYFAGTTDFDPTQWEYIISSTNDTNGGTTWDAYLWKSPPDGNW